jgi:hypothetical protein
MVEVADAAAEEEEEADEGEGALSPAISKP